jgi:hypothetical protein
MEEQRAGQEGQAASLARMRGHPLHRADGHQATPGGSRAFTSTEVVYGVTGTEVTGLPEYGVSP